MLAPPAAPRCRCRHSPQPNIALRWAGLDSGAPQMGFVPLGEVPVGGEMVLDHTQAFVACNCGRCGLPLHPAEG